MNPFLLRCILECIMAEYLTCMSECYSTSWKYSLYVYCYICQCSTWRRAVLVALRLSTILSLFSWSSVYEPPPTNMTAALPLSLASRSFYCLLLLLLLLFVYSYSYIYIYLLYLPWVSPSLLEYEHRRALSWAHSPSAQPIRSDHEPRWTLSRWHSPSRS
jgi:hypothetical protein